MISSWDFFTYRRGLLRDGGRAALIFSILISSRAGIVRGAVAPPTYFSRRHYE